MEMSETHTNTFIHSLVRTRYHVVVYNLIPKSLVRAPHSEHSFLFFKYGFSTTFRFNCMKDKHIATANLKFEGFSF